MSFIDMAYLKKKDLQNGVLSYRRHKTDQQLFIKWEKPMQKIVDIYLALFEHVLPLFTGVLLDVVSPQNMNSNSSEIYGLITLAMLDIMNELPIADIKTGLVRFEETRQIWYPDSPLRLNLESCSEEDYPRVLCAIDQLKTEGVYITTK